MTGQQWVWTFSYPQNGNVESDQLYLPVNRPVVFNVHSEDVIHSFWVVQMGIKVDANPGETTKTSVLPDRLGASTSGAPNCAGCCTPTWRPASTWSPRGLPAGSPRTAGTPDEGHERRGRGR